MRFKTVALLVGIVMWMTAPAWAGTTSFIFTDGYSSGPHGTQLTYTSNGFSITASGYYTNNSSDDLYVKDGGGDENGLGLVSQDSDHEINTNQFIQLDLTSLANAGITSGNLTIGSVQSDEGYAIYDSSALGNLGSSELTGTTDDSPFSVSWSASDPILGITAFVPKGGSNGSDVLLMSLSTCTQNDPTPEPASLALMGTGLLGLAFAYRRYSKIFLAKNQ